MTTFTAVEHKRGILTLEVIENELQKQASIYLETIKQIGSKILFKSRTEEKLVELETKLVTLQAEAEPRMDLITQIQEAMISHKNNLETLDLNTDQAIKNMEAIEDVVDYLWELIDEVCEDECDLWEEDEDLSANPA